jgi:hypothetical protein
LTKRASRRNQDGVSNDNCDAVDRFLRSSLKD